MQPANAKPGFFPALRKTRNLLAHSLFLILFISSLPTSNAHHATTNVGDIPWVDTAIEIATGTWAPLDFDESGTKLGLLYAKSSTVRFALFENGVWTTKQVATGGTYGILDGILTYGGGDIWYAAYEESALGDVIFASTTNDGNTWTLATVDTSGTLQKESQEMQVSGTTISFSHATGYYISTNSGVAWTKTVCVVGFEDKYYRWISGTGASTNIEMWGQMPTTSAKDPAAYMFSSNNCQNAPTSIQTYWGDWVASTSYATRDVVYYSGAYYEALRATVGDLPDEPASLDWDSFSNVDGLHELTMLDNVNTYNDQTAAVFYYWPATTAVFFRITSATLPLQMYSTNGVTGDFLTWYDSQTDLRFRTNGNEKIKGDNAGDVITMAYQDCDGTCDAVEHNGYAFSDNSGVSWRTGRLPLAPYQYVGGASTPTRPQAIYSNGVYYYAYQATDGTLHILGGEAGIAAEEELPPNQNTNNPLGQIIGNMNESWGLDFSILFGIGLVGMVAVAFARVNRAPLLIAIGSFLGILAAVQFGLFPEWIIYVILFIIIAVGGVTLFESRRKEE